MDLNRAIGVAASGLKAQAGRMRRKLPTMRPEFDRELDAQVVALGRVERDRSEFKVRHEPGNPLADAAGNVRLPNVDPLIEQMDMREAQRNYEANLNMVGSARRMIARTLDILRA